MSPQPSILVQAFPQQPLAWDIDPEMLGTSTPLYPATPLLHCVPNALPRRVAQLRGDQPEPRNAPSPPLGRQSLPPSPLSQIVHSEDDTGMTERSKDTAFDVHSGSAEPSQHDEAVITRQEQPGPTSPESGPSASPPVTPDFDFGHPLEAWADLAGHNGDRFPYPLDDPRFVPLMPDELSTLEENAMYIHWAAKTIAKQLNLDSIEEFVFDQAGPWWHHDDANATPISLPEDTPNCAWSSIPASDRPAAAGLSEHPVIDDK